MLRTVMKIKPKAIPKNGAIKINTETFISPDNTRIEKLAVLATAAPTRPPIRAWEEEVGNPHHQVNRSHTMAPIKADKITEESTTDGSIIPLPMVVATCNPKTPTATKLKKAAQMTACLGERTRVETTVATELAAS